MVHVPPEGTQLGSWIAEDGRPSFRGKRRNQKYRNFSDLHGQAWYLGFQDCWEQFVLPLHRHGGVPEL